jgi:hypothetical protein
MEAHQERSLILARSLGSFQFAAKGAMLRNQRFDFSHIPAWLKLV